MRLQKLTTTVFGVLISTGTFTAAAHADRPPSWAEKERMLRTSLFADDNPARYVGQEQFLQQQQQEMQRQQQQNEYQQQRLQYQQQQQYEQQQRADQRAAYQQQQQQQSAGRQQQRQQQQQPQDGNVVGFKEDGSVEVRSGNKMVDESAGNYLNRKFRNVLNTLWR